MERDLNIFINAGSGREKLRPEHTPAVIKAADLFSLV
jgi:hypothetical protein